MIDFNSSEKMRSTEVNLTPMIDIIFNLLIFFLITAVISQKGLNLKLPESSTAEKRPKKSLEISVTKNEEILFNGEKTAQIDVEKVLREEKNKPASQKADSIVLNSFQDDLDEGADRDAGYIYGPRIPRMFIVGIKGGI